MAMASIEGISIEVFYILSHIPTVVIAIVSVPIGGGMLLFVHRVIQRRKFTIHHSWKPLVIICLLMAAVQFTWFDAVKRIGAGKTALILVPLETVGTVVFAWLMLSERLYKLQIVGGIIVISGITLVVSGDVTPSESQFGIGIGEIEAISSALLSALSTILITRMLKDNADVLETTAVLLLASGLILALSLPFMNTGPLFEFEFEFGNSSAPTWLYLILVAPLIPVVLNLTNLSSLKSIGASLTTIIWSCSSILTVIVAFILVQTGLPLEIPENMTLAIVGGIVSVGGIGLILRQ